VVSKVVQRFASGVDIFDDDGSGGARARDGGAELRVLCYGAMVGQVIHILA